MSSLIPVLALGRMLAAAARRRDPQSYATIDTARARGEARHQARVAAGRGARAHPDPLQAEHQADNDNAVADREWTV